MCKLRTFVLLVSILPILACQQDEDPPDLAEIARDYCAIMQMCDPGDWESKEECEVSSAEEFKRTKAENRKCFDALIIMETCLGAFESCDEYVKFEQDPAYECRTELSEFYAACLEP
ncbi:MAG: hypothetical protein H0T76_20530 [Nannocystis sp.]|nr:hypothetical protein [Nannocystis sp.]MBA3548877.1 hypothetical protein [Nannocystis sp.]